MACGVSAASPCLLTLFCPSLKRFSKYCVRLISLGHLSESTSQQESQHIAARIWWRRHAFSLFLPLSRVDLPPKAISYARTDLETSTFACDPTQTSTCVSATWIWTG